MAYLSRRTDHLGRPLAGCGPGCRCAPGLRPPALGEWYVPEDDEAPPPPARPRPAPGPAPGPRLGWSGGLAGLAAAIEARDPRSGASCRAEERRIRPVVEPPAADLVAVPPRSLADPSSPRLLHAAALQAYLRMKAAAEADGIPARLLTVVSGYRSVAHQERLWRAALARYGSPAAARRWVAPPGGSPHHTGRAVDLALGARNDSANIPALRATPAYRWLVCNAARFGFTPYAAEPWHWEYNPPGVTFRGRAPAAPSPSPSPPAAPGTRPARRPAAPSSAPRPGPGKAGPPQAPGLLGLLRREEQPARETLYVAIPLGTEGPARPMTGIFVPEGFRPGPTVDLILYLHGFKDPGLTIDRYWNRGVSPQHDFREGLNAARKNAVLVAPTLGPHSQSGRLTRPGGLDGYLEQVVAALVRFGPFRGSPPPAIRHLVLACHSGGGWPMRQLALGGDRGARNVRECWGFDCLYNRGDETEWARWARAHPGARLYVHYGNGNTARRSELLRGQGVPNVVVEGSLKLAHGLVPKAHWQERLRTAAFLADT